MHYHVWFGTKYRKKILIGKIGQRLREIFLEVMQNKNFVITEMAMNLDHVHMLIEAKNEKEL